MLKLKHLDRALRYEARMNELESRPKVGADGTAHEWDCISPGGTTRSTNAADAERDTWSSWIGSAVTGRDSAARITT